MGVMWGKMEKNMETTIMGYVGGRGRQNYGAVLDPYYNTAPNM